MPPAWPSAPLRAGLLCIKGHPSWLTQLPADLGHDLEVSHASDDRERLITTHVPARS